MQRKEDGEGPKPPSALGLAYRVSTVLNALGKPIDGIVSLDPRNTQDDVNFHYTFHDGPTKYGVQASPRRAELFERCHETAIKIADNDPEVSVDRLMLPLSRIANESRFQSTVWS